MRKISSKKPKRIRPDGAEVMRLSTSISNSLKRLQELGAVPGCQVSSIERQISACIIDWRDK